MKRRGRTSFPSREERGQAVVEFSAIVLLIVILAFGIIEMGRMALIYISLADGARAGVRYAMVHGANCTTPCVPSTSSSYGNVQTQVTNVTSLAGIAISPPVVTYVTSGSDPNGNLTGDTVKVVASYTYAPIITLSAFSPLNLNLSSTSQGTICY